MLKQYLQSDENKYHAPRDFGFGLVLSPEAVAQQYPAERKRKGGNADKQNGRQYIHL